MPPAEALSVLAGVLRHATLQRIVVLASTRKRLVLRNDQGADLGEIDDDVVTVAKGTHKGLTFRQIELEFGDGRLPHRADRLRGGRGGEEDPQGRCPH